MTGIHHFREHAMATHFEVRLAGVEAGYAAQAARAAFDCIHALETKLSRFRPQSEISRIALLQAGEAMRVSAETFLCLQIAKAMEAATAGAFSPTAIALQHQASPPQWSLNPETSSIRCESGVVEFDLGAIGKGFALDRAAELLREWECPAYLLVAGGSSILAGDPAPSIAGWSCGLGDDGSPHRLLLANSSLSGSGLGVKGSHILDPRTVQPASRQTRAWALCDTAAESDALSTAAMVLSLTELEQVLEAHHHWLVLLDGETAVQTVGRRPMPPAA